MANVNEAPCVNRGFESYQRIAQQWAFPVPAVDSPLCPLAPLKH